MDRLVLMELGFGRFECIFSCCIVGCQVDLVISLGLE